MKYNQQFEVEGVLSLSSPMLRLCQSADGVLFAGASATKIQIYSAADMKLQSQTQVASEVQSLIFGSLGRDVEASGHTLVFSNRTHIGYLGSAMNLSGVITSLNRQVYLMSAEGQRMIFCDDEGQPTQTTFDSRLCGLLTAIADGRQGDAQMLLRRVKANNLGLSAVSRLIQAGMNKHALVLLGNEY